ncbi:FKBP-type peptidyl-prolyl cis-trans isomerase [Algoriphagus winogradskyi]|uniref:Peptidyl-prolyl cis-trans isomerase n=1 Tax=Algoriphagus winogradskyi TaxID=237017 RepID=A0ABY1NQV6_9BACT|nr:FKBP-type peptidyl-prolyl cis-trans isomerase [Algoriphagus winogradskyi]SMP15984.1 FKBP-type peptidyl-prolyl cis-trans isomerase [Algoriphagus winogradskyi]
MKFRLFSILSLIAGSLAFVSCIDEEATDATILANDKAAILAYVDTTTIVNVKEFHDEASGIRIIWQLEAQPDTISEFYSTDTVTVNYTGKFLTNQVFETTVESVAKANGIYNQNKNYEPVQFILGGVIAGFQFGISQMETGEKATVFIPSRYAYGRNGQGNIGANTPLIFELELVKVNPGPRN